MNKTRNNGKTFLIVALGVTILNLVFFSVYGFPQLRQNRNLSTEAGILSSETSDISLSTAQTVQPTGLQNTPTPMVLPTLAPDASSLQGMKREGVFILSLADGTYYHLFAYHPQYFPLTRLTNEPWDDITPAVSPDGKLIAYSSRQKGTWDIFILDLATNTTTQLTNTADYDASPTWSPDGQWLAYESLVYGNLEILVRPSGDPAQAAIRLTDDSAADFAPTWSPGGRQIAFVSTRSGTQDIWLADLEKSDNRFTNVSKTSELQEEYPEWSPDGARITWVVTEQGNPTVVVWDQKSAPSPVGSGNRPVWSPTGDAILTEIRMPNQTGLAAYNLNDRSLQFPFLRMPGDLMGMDWKIGYLPEYLTSMSFLASARDPADPLWTSAISLNPKPPEGRFGVAPLNDVAAPFAFLHDEVDESFNTLRIETAVLSGWDFLSSLENAYIPLTEPLEPGIQNDWLLTGRGIAVNSLPMYAGWVVVSQEYFEGQLYWRVYLKARFQDGTQGRPLTNMTWNFNVRSTGNPAAYEAGGQIETAPAGYWIDFTTLASHFGWERLPAWTDWRAFLPAARFNQFILTNGLDWDAAMAEIYPPEMISTQNPRSTRTPTTIPTTEAVLSATLLPSNTLPPSGTPAP